MKPLKLAGSLFALVLLSGDILASSKHKIISLEWSHDQN